MIFNEAGKTVVNKFNKIESLYNFKMNKDIKKVLSDNERYTFDGHRVLHISEILDPIKNFDIDFVKLRLLPIIDCSDNDLIVYEINNKCFSKFNIVDNIIYKSNINTDSLFDMTPNNG